MEAMGDLAVMRRVSAIPALMRCTSLLARHADLRDGVARHIAAHLKAVWLQRFPEHEPTVRLYGSLHHGLYVPGYSKITLDFTVPDTESAFATSSTLHVLCSLLQGREPTEDAPISFPVLVWHRTLHRPYVLILFWDEMLVHVTTRNQGALVTSDLMWRVLADYPLLRMVLLNLKDLLMRETSFLGALAGQVSTYALFVILHPHVESLGRQKSFRKLDSVVRTILANHLQGVPHPTKTKDPCNASLNLTASAFLAPYLSQWLLKYNMEP